MKLPAKIKEATKLLCDKVLKPAREENRLTDQEYMLALVYLERIDSLVDGRDVVLH